MYNEKIENLINLALADGELTEKEKQILFKKAEAAGIDLDEFEMVLDAKLFEKQQTTKQPVAQTSAAPKSNKLGDVKKCPACGAIAEAFTSTCSDCGFEFRNIGANKSVEQLSKQLQAVVDSCDNKSYDEEYERTKDITAKQKDVISNFPIPQTREDLLELLYFIQPKIKADFSSDVDVSAWRNKFTEIINRARVAFASDKKVITELDKYENELKFSIQKNKKNNFLNKALSTAGILAAVGFLLFFSGIIDLELKKEQKRLNAIEEEITYNIREKRFADASLLLNQLDWSLTEDRSLYFFIDYLIKHKDKYEDKRKYWDNKKSQLETLIKNNYK